MTRDLNNLPVEIFMAETIETFVKKLQAEGVDAGKESAEKLKAEAEGQAQEIIRKAEAQADKLVADARTEADNLLTRSRTELELAARDAVLQLRETLGQVLQGLLTAPVKKELSSADFLKTLIQDVVGQYARADCEGTGTITLAVPENMQAHLGDWVVQEFQKASKDATAPVDLKATLAVAGFEYSVSGGTVEVTLDSVVETLRELVGASLKETLDKAMAGGEG